MTDHVSGGRTAAAVVAVLLGLGAGCRADPEGDDDGGDDGTVDTDTALTLEDGFEASLTRVGGCSDIVVYAVNDADTVMLTVRFDGPLESGVSSDSTLEEDLPGQGVVVEVVEGDRVSDTTCDDAVEGGGPVVYESWKGGTGHVVLVIDFDEADPEADPTVDVTVTDVRFRATYGTGDPTLDTFSWSNVAVGWLPG